MNIYVQFSSKSRFLNLKPANPNANGFDYIRFSDGALCHHDESFNDYVRNVVTNTRHHLTYFFTPASSVTELYSLHPELLI